MIVQRALLKLHTAGLLSGLGRHLLERRVWTVEAGEAAGLKLVLPQNLDFVHGSSEGPVQRCIAKHLKAGGVFCDVGANVGFFSLLAARLVGPLGAVYSIEPLSQNAEAIRRNAALNKLSNLEVFEVAADERSGTSELFVTSWDGGSSLSASAVPASEACEMRAVQVMTIDELIESQRLRPPTFFKIDVEGAELRVLRGMQETLVRRRPILLYEVDDVDRAGLERRWNELHEFVSRLGYSVTRLDDSYPNQRWFVGHSLAAPQ